LNSQTLKAKEVFLAINYNPKLGLFTDTTSEDSESDEVFAAPAKGKPNPEGTGKKLQCKEKVGNETAAAKDPRPPAKKYKTPTDKVCSSSLVISLVII